MQRVSHAKSATDSHNGKPHMNSYTYEQLSVGMEEHFEHTVTSEMMDRFLQVCGDCNPLHCDEEYAKSFGFPGRVVYGMLSASLYSTLVGVYLPGEHCLLYSVDTKFRKPVFIGDTLQVSGTVAEKNDSVEMVTIDAVIMNQNREKVSKAVLKVGFLFPQKSPTGLDN